jgi:SnoaL-like domain
MFATAGLAGMASLAGPYCRDAGATSTIDPKQPRLPEENSMKPEDMSAQWELYARAWSAVSDPERTDILHKALAPSFTYMDPRIECKSPSEMQKNLEAFQGRQPGGRFALRDCLPHHDVALVNWQLIKGDGTASNTGYDFVQFAPSGQIARITGFFAKPSAPAPSCS